MSNRVTLPDGRIVHLPPAAAAVRLVVSREHGVLAPPRVEFGFRDDHGALRWLPEDEGAVAAAEAIIGNGC